LHGPIPADGADGGFEIGNFQENYGFVAGWIGLGSLLLQTYESGVAVEPGEVSRLLFGHSQAERFDVEAPGPLEVLEVDFHSGRTALR